MDEDRSIKAFVQGQRCLAALLIASLSSQVTARSFGHEFSGNGPGI